MPSQHNLSRVSVRDGGRRSASVFTPHHMIQVDVDADTKRLNALGQSGRPALDFAYTQEVELLNRLHEQESGEDRS